MELLDQHIEALIFSSEHNITEKEIKATLEATLKESMKPNHVVESIGRIKDKFAEESFAIELVKINNGYTFMTKTVYHDTIGNHLKKVNKKKLSRAALETLSIIAYKQPVTKIEVESIRGVNCDYVVQKLLEKELVEISGRSDSPGRPLIYKTSDKFMDYFGISDVSDLPKPKDFAVPESEIGEPAPIEEAVNESQTEETNPGPAKEGEHQEVEAEKTDETSAQEGKENNPIENEEVTNTDETRPEQKNTTPEEIKVEGSIVPEIEESVEQERVEIIENQAESETSTNDIPENDHNVEPEVADIAAHIAAEKAKLENPEQKQFTVYMSDEVENSEPDRTPLDTIKEEE